MTPEEYLATERRADRKSEYLDGRVLAMTGATERHNLIVANLIIALGSQLRGSGCRVYPSDLKVRAGATRYFYPDVSIICGAPEFPPDGTDVILNPRVLIEVMSESTTAFDRGAKFLAYQQLPSLRDYLLVSQDQPLIEHFRRQDGDAWLYTRVDDTANLLSVQARLRLGEVYAEVEGLS